MAQLPHKTLKSGFSLPVLGLGTWLMGGDKAVDADADLAREVTAVQTALSLGFRHIDTAEMYAAGVAETIVAEAIKDYSRADLTIASKAMAENIGYDDLLRALDGSLRRLQTGYIDLYYLHGPNDSVPPQETARALNRAYKDGLVRHVAVSNYKPERIDALQAYLDMPIAACQAHYSLVFREPAVAGLLDHAVAHDYFVVAWRPLRFQDRRADPAKTHKNAWERGAYPVLDAVADRNHKTNIQTALNWVVAHPNVVTLVKSSQPAHIKELLGGCGWQLSPEDFRRLTDDFRPQESVSNSVPLR